VEAEEKQYKKNILNSLAAAIHENKRNAACNRFYTPELRLARWSQCQFLYVF